MQIITSRLVLRALQDADLDTFVAYRNDPAVAQWQSWPQPYSTEAAQQLIQDADANLPPVPGRWRQVGICLKDTGQLIGDCAFCLTDEGRQAEIGITLSQPAQGQGYANEALRALFTHLFGQLGIHRLSAACDPANAGSIRLLRALGLREEGRFVQASWIRNQWVDDLWFALLQHEWLTGSGA
ncbi:GNAT family N-acetyltransferase [Parachitinimonas caeni]|uniref:GNAT family protein n=1 Tax=Parachitinimonas caeni TaxID=3031301 RepID=A0ABT7DZ41_9NEIS|nr:GNAT family protein [Parachitinimonas caeni]MDK2125264.1 GNAT family protein [Parachitinimonas caeni]